jgi:hypothetical protein
MNFKTTYILFGILAVVLGIFIYTLFVGPSSGDSSAWVLPNMHNEANPFPTKDIDRVEIDRHRPSEEKIVLVRDAASESWRIVEPRDYRADKFAVEDLLRQIYDARRDTRADVTNDPKAYGLEQPAAVITLQKETDPKRQVTLNVGDVSPGQESAVIYVTSSDRSKEIMAVAKKQLDKVLATLADFRSRDLLSPSSGDIQAFTLVQRSKDKAVKGPVELKKGSEDRWGYVQPPYGDAQASGTDTPATDKPPSNVQSVLTDISNLKVDSNKDFVQDDATDLAKYHLDPAKDDILRIEIDRVEQITKDSEGAKEKKTAKVALVVGVGKKVDDKSDQYYAYLDDPKHKDVIKISAKSIEPFVKLLDKPDALRDRNLIALGFSRKPDAIDIKNSWGLLEFCRGSDTQKPWKLWRGDKSYAVDDSYMQSMINLLTAPNQVESFPDPATKAQLGLDKPNVVVTLWADGLAAEEKKEEKKDDKKDGKKDEKKEEKKEKKPEPKDKSKPAFTLSFGDLQGNSVAVERKRGDEKNGTIVLVPAKLRDQVRQGPLAYLDKELPPFNTNRFDATSNVTKLALTREGITYEISHEDKAGAPWRIDKPSDFAGRTADRATIEDILRSLNTLRAVKIEDDKIPADAKLAEWGLKNPRFKAVVTLTKDGKPKTFEYDFGKETDDKSGIYLRTSQQDMIVIVANSVVTTLQRELQDLTVFQFDVAKVKGVKMTGWIDLQRKRGIDQPDVLEAKRDKNGSDWIVETPKGFKLDAGKLNDFLQKLSTLKAMKFVAHKATPTADHGLDVTKGALQIEITIEGEKEPLRLTVGKQDGNAAFFAVTNKLPGDIFDVPKDLFEKAKDGPGYFSKQ